MINLKSVTAGAIGAFLIGCGASDEFSDAAEVPRVFHGIPSVNDLDIEDIAGEWYVENEIIGPNGDIWAVNEFYLRITEDGRHIEYDYQGDSFATRNGTYANCYIKRSEYTMEKMPDGSFYHLGESVTTTTETGGTLTFAWTYYAYYDVQDGALLVPIESTEANPVSVLAPPSPVSQAEVESLLCED